MYNKKIESDKMNKKIIYVVMLILLTSCSLQRNKKEDYLPGVEIPISEMNTTIILDPSLGMEDVFKSTGLLSLEVKNISDTPIRFSSNFGTVVFLLENNIWIQVQNSFGYPEGDIFLPSQKDYSSGILIHLLPELPEVKKPYLIRVIAIGVTDKQLKKVGAYIDIRIK